MKDSAPFYRVLGLMSGTSLDGLDMAFVTFRPTAEGWTFQLGPATSLDYDPDRRAQLKDSVWLSGLELSTLDRIYGRWLGTQAKAFLNTHQLEVDFIASHGHTVFHQLDKRLTLQIGHGQELAHAAGQKVICDFRTKDVVLGGQGAPLVPIGDELLFGAYDFCLNLGGISNVSFRKAGKRVAFDIGLANMVLNHLTPEVGLTYDRGGVLAASGTLHQELFDQMNSLPYFDLPFPKSTGYEWFVEEVVPILERFQNEAIADRLCTSVHHVAYQVAEAVKAEAAEGARLWVTGGGAKNDFLIATLREYLGDRVAVVVPDESLIEFKEAIVFALMGVLRERGEVNCLSTVTGAEHDNCGGVVFEP